MKAAAVAILLLQLTLAPSRAEPSSSLSEASCVEIVPRSNLTMCLTAYASQGTTCAIMSPCMHKDPSQLWIRRSYAGNVDSHGLDAFELVNTGSQLALQHYVDAFITLGTVGEQPGEQPDLNSSLWTRQAVSHNYYTLRSYDQPNLVVTWVSSELPCMGSYSHGEINQEWAFINSSVIRNYTNAMNAAAAAAIILVLQFAAPAMETKASELPSYCAAQFVPRANLTMCVTGLSQGIVVMSRCIRDDPQQLWSRSSRAGYRDPDGRDAFVIINLWSRLALQHGHESGSEISCGSVQRVNSSLWTMASASRSYVTLRSYDNPELVLDIVHGDWTHGGVRENSFLIAHPYNHQENEQWAFINSVC
ncbi:ricin B-like lectin R40C1 [Selaginella moellendorffii]|uniref:ricin B-like lectin R40C1 n=1 Tax=Selaginella moellendorffii TaxID=88036 RepID=UPI000D1C7066|nr:ricin B-like lectin R40C1 [Selaginella moellendorffii]|eukprot:XP_024519508.1 ricin B-like lectin R40C1 [Selaginella moellendorffii]